MDIIAIFKFTVYVSPFMAFPKLTRMSLLKLLPHSASKVKIPRWRCFARCHSIAGWVLCASHRSVNGTVDQPPAAPIDGYTRPVTP